MLSSSEKLFWTGTFQTSRNPTCLKFLCSRPCTWTTIQMSHEQNEIKWHQEQHVFGRFQPVSTFFNPCQLTRRIRSGFAQKWVIQWFVITERSGNRSPDCNFHADPESQKQQRIENDEFPAPLELQLPVLLQDPCRPSWVNQPSALHAASWFEWCFGW